MKLPNSIGLASILAVLCCLASTAVLAKGLSDEQKLVERSKIEELISRSTWAFDTQDVDAWLATFTPDGEWLTQYVSCKGQEALRAYITKLSCVGVPGGGRQLPALLRWVPLQRARLAPPALHRRHPWPT